MKYEKNQAVAQVNGMNLSLLHKRYSGTWLIRYVFLATPIKDLLQSISLIEERHERTLSNGHRCRKFIPC
jgi:hypothetical protein